MTMNDHQRGQIIRIFEEFIRARIKKIRALRIDDLNINPFLIRILVSQMRRAAISVGMNLVEGSMRFNSGEFRQFVGIARGSAAEVGYQLLLAKDLGYISDQVYEELRSGYDRVGQMLTRLGQSLDQQ